MKHTLLCIIIFVAIPCFSQTQPRLNFIGTVFMTGTGTTGDNIHASFDNSAVSSISTTVDEEGNFRIDYPKPITAGSLVRVWAEKKGQLSEAISVPAMSDAALLTKAVEDAKSTSTIAGIAGKLKRENYELRNTNLWYPGTIITTNFTVPMARFNLVKKNDQKKGDILLFSSIGAGIGISGGRMQVIRDSEGKIVSEEFSNTFGLFAGFLFSAGTGEDAKNVFAPTLSIGILDFQVGIGRELGDIGENQRRTFYTLAYSIPLYKLVTKGYRKLFFGDPYHAE